MVRLLLVFLAGLIAACAAPESGSANEPVVAALIVKPRGELAPEQVVRAVSESLDGAARVRHVRRLSGDAHLIHVMAPATRDEVPALIERLRASGRFEYVEPDVLLKKH